MVKRAEFEDLRWELYEARQVLTDTLMALEIIVRRQHVCPICGHLDTHKLDCAIVRGRVLLARRPLGDEE